MRTLQIQRAFLTALTILFSLQTAVFSQPVENAEQFLGRWSLYLPGGAGYMKVHHDQGFTDAELLWYGGSIVPVAGLYFTDEGMILTRTSTRVLSRDASGGPLRTHLLTHQFEFKKVSEDELSGRATVVNKNGIGTEVTEFTARRLPPLPQTPDLSKIKYGKPVVLFNGKDLSKWTLVNPGDRSPYQVIDKTLVNLPVEGNGKLGKFRTIQEFEDFRLNLEMNLPGECNSGIYLRGVYEIQVKYSYGKKPTLRSTGALYGRIVPSEPAEKPAGQWQEMEIILFKQHLTVELNGIRIIDNQPVEGVTGGALSADEFVPGPIYLQGNHSRGVSYRNMVLTPILN